MKKVKYEDSQTDVEESASTSGNLQHEKRLCSGSQGIKDYSSGNFLFLETKDNFPKVKNVD